MAKIALFSLSCKPFYVFNMLFLFSFIPFFIFYLSREVGNQGRTQARPAIHLMISSES